jgi:hypothetical protein
LAEKMREIRDLYNQYDPQRIRTAAMERYSATSIARRLEQIYDEVVLLPHERARC